MTELCLHELASTNVDVCDSARCTNVVLLLQQRIRDHDRPAKQVIERVPDVNPRTVTR